MTKSKLQQYSNNKAEAFKRLIKRNLFENTKLR